VKVALTVPALFSVTVTSLIVIPACIHPLGEALFRGLACATKKSLALSLVRQPPLAEKAVGCPVHPRARPFPKQLAVLHNPQVSRMFVLDGHRA
jgi:hypothetical protein